MIFPNGPNAVTVSPSGAVGAMMSSASQSSVRPSRKRHPAKTASSLALVVTTDGRAPARPRRSCNGNIGVTIAFFTFQPFDNIHIRKAADAQLVLFAISAQYFSM
ncbi:hypothetical protein [Mesorhizobium sp. WSM4303]|uniref:hypothetical protein n=1 Tax=Mesorhizobium sp. WSM4303 TaxID=2589887 RepID=UPI00163D8489|nr:hypothetical protein [Mesorhizobium sp. WSM4303]